VYTFEETAMLGRFGKSVLAVGVVIAIAGSVQAQGQGRGRGFGGGMGGGMLLGNEGVQKEIKATDEQVEKLQKLSESMREKGRAEFEKYQDLSQEERREKMQAFAKSMNEEMNKELKEILKPDQLKRFNQIALQVRGSQAFADAEIQAKLDLTADQKDKIKGIQEDSNKKMQEIREANQGDFQAMMPKFQALRKETNEKTTAVLTDSQKKTWKELTGEPFEVQFGPPRGR
jgi:hypothetical protein